MVAAQSGSAREWPVTVDFDSMAQERVALGELAALMMEQIEH